MTSENMTSSMIKDTEYQQGKMLEIESNISKLLQTTKKLLKDLTLWSSGECIETVVYEDYSALENYFANAAQAFESVLLPMDDMMKLPDELFACLKKMTTQPPSSTTLGTYLPPIRDTILKLLQGLKLKQKTLRERFEPSQKPSPLNLKLPYQKRTSIPQTPISPLLSISPQRQHEEESIYLKWRNRTKKLTIDKSALTIPTLYHLFCDTFLLKENENEVIYILDYHTKVEYELENIQDIQPNSMLILKDITALEYPQQEWKQWIEDTITRALQQPKQKDWEELVLLKKDLDELNRLYARFKSEMTTIITDIREKSMQKKDSVVVIDRQLHQDMDEKRRLTQKAATSVSTRLEHLQDKIDQLKTDVTQRRRRPSKLQLEDCQAELKQIKKDLDALNQSMKKVKPTWKKTWEVELQQIVKEQQFLKEQEALVVDLIEDHTAIEEVVEQLVKIYEINERKKKLPKDILVDEDFEGMKTVLKQLSCVQIDHTKRVKALEEAEQLRSKELAQRMDAFERELTDFVELKKLKSVGGTEAIEKIRQEKDKEMIKALNDMKS